MVTSPSRLFSEIATAERPTETRVLMRRAVVLGGSIAGLMAARVLSDHADEVLIIERDPSDVDGGPRPGVPQGSQVHALLPAGQIQLERWFPGIVDEALALGAPPPPGDPGAAKIFVNGVLGLPPAPSDTGPMLITTRPFLEALVRRRTLAVGNIRMVYGRAEGLVLANRRVAGARYVPDGGGEPVVEPADLVVDAMGRSSRLSDWLADNGWPRPPMQRMPIKLNYATALFKQDEKVSDAWVVVYHTMAGKGRSARIGGINSVEGDRWIMLVAATTRTGPPATSPTSPPAAASTTRACSATSPNTGRCSAGWPRTTRRTADAGTSTSSTACPPDWSPPVTRSPPSTRCTARA
uniref:FAD-dependent oxidoreductase n=1 Tax=Micromonospora acroterricola TaxID=2202421 RepID=UPI00191C6EBF|nr:hypothetical protein [Micromonospora acroterricola]